MTSLKFRCLSGEKRFQMGQQTTGRYKSQSPWPYGPSSFIGSLSGFEMAHNNNTIHKGAEMWLVPCFMKQEAPFALTARLSLKPKWRKNKTGEGILITCCQILNQSLETYTTDHVVSDADNDISHFSPQWNTTRVLIPDTLLITNLLLSNVQVEDTIRTTFIDGSPASIGHGTNEFWRNHKDSPLQTLAYGETFLCILEGAATEVDYLATRAPTIKKCGNRQMTHQGRNVNYYNTSGSR